MSVRGSGLVVTRCRRVAMLGAVGVCVVLVMSAVASAATFTVNDSTDAALSSPLSTLCSSTDGGGCTLRAAVQAADNAGGGSTITLPAGDYKLTIPSTASADPSTGDLDVGDSGNDVVLTVVGASASSTTIDANHLDRAFAVDAPGDALSLSGVSITGGDAGVSPASTNTNSTDPHYGGAIYNDGALTVTDSTLNGNESYSDGGAIDSGNGATSTTIVGSTVSRDVSANNDAGGVEVDQGTMSVTNSTLDYDSATNGYAAAVEFNSNVAGTIAGSTIDHDSAYESGAIGDYAAGSLSITASDISDDAAQYYDGTGGALQTDGAGTVSLSSSTLDGDSSGYGGAIELDSPGTATISDDTFANDSAVYYDGGAIYDGNTAAVAVTADTFTGDSADAGAAVYFGGSGELISNSTFDGNAGYYGAIYLHNAGVQLTNDTIADNQGTDGGGIYAADTASGIVNTIVADNAGGDCASGPVGLGVDQGNNVDSDGSCFATGGVGSTPEVAGDLVSVNPELGPLAVNGGPTETDALLAASPAIGAALSSACPTTDQRGVTRPAACDVGAYQSAPADVALSASGPASSTVGSPISDTLSATDNGPAPATGVTVTDTLPAGTTYFSSSASQGACTGTTTVTCALGTLDSSATGSANTATVTIVTVPSQSGSEANTATVSADQTDPNPANNTASATTAVGALATVSGATAKLAPVVLSGVASQKTATSVTLSGIVNAAGQSTHYDFQLGVGPTYGTTILGATLADTSTPQGVVISVKSLTPATTYHYRVLATNATGTTYGQDVSFKTAKAKPVAITLTATHHDGRLMIAGKVKLPAGVSAAAGCKGTVTIRAKLGARTVVTRRASVTHRCTYSRSMILPGARTRTITATFGGNRTLIRRSSRTISID